MKLNAGIVTSKLSETKSFYTKYLDFGVTFENEFYLLMHTPGREAEISFCCLIIPHSRHLFRQSFQGRGMYLTIEVDDVDSIYRKSKARALK